MALETLKDVKEIGGFKMVHLPKPVPREEYLEMIKDTFIIHGMEFNTLIFKIQDGPIRENGVNGCQVDTIIETARLIIQGLDKNYPSAYNRQAIRHLELALLSLRNRTKDREQRGAEGTNAE